jgi:hypothetical protein
MQDEGLMRPEHQAQVINYLETAGFGVGLLVNFGKPKFRPPDLVSKRHLQWIRGRTLICRRSRVV